MEITERLIKAAEEVDSGEHEYSCVALTFNIPGNSVDECVDEYEHLFIPDLDNKEHSFAGQLDVIFGAYSPVTKQWRVLALCFFAAMKEQGA